MDDLEDSTETVDVDEVTITALDDQDAVRYPLWERWLLNAHLTPKRRTISLCLSLIICVVLLGALVVSGSYPVLRTMTGSIIRSFEPTPTPVPTPINNKFFVDANIAGTQVFIDGLKLGHLPQFNGGVPLTLANGHHLITWKAYPFRTQLCRLSVPGANNDTCQLADFGLHVQNSAVPAQMLMLQETLAGLPANLRASLNSALQSAITGIHASTPLTAGEMYDGPNGEITAQQPLIATLHFTLAQPLTSTANGQSQMLDGEYCPQICIVPAQASSTPATTNQWMALVLVQSYWDYATTNGRSIANHMPIDNGAASDGANPILVRITGGSAGWQVQPLIGLDQAPPLAVYGGLPHDILTSAHITQIPVDPACVVAEDLFQVGHILPFRVRFVSSPNVALGCLVAAPVLTHAPVAYFIEHLGVFYAANAAAHDMQPDLPDGRCLREEPGTAPAHLPQTHNAVFAFAINQGCTTEQGPGEGRDIPCGCPATLTWLPLGGATHNYIVLTYTPFRSCMDMGASSGR